MGFFWFFLRLGRDYCLLARTIEPAHVKLLKAVRPDFSFRCVSIYCLEHHDTSQKLMRLFVSFFSIIFVCEDAIFYSLEDTITTRVRTRVCLSCQA